MYIIYIIYVSSAICNPNQLLHAHFELTMRNVCYGSDCTKTEAVLHAKTYLFCYSLEFLMTPKTFTLVFVSVALQYPLHVAAGQGDLSAVKTLVGRGADINAKDDNGVCKFKKWLTLLFDIITKGLFLS